MITSYNSNGERRRCTRCNETITGGQDQDGNPCCVECHNNYLIDNGLEKRHGGARKYSSKSLAKFFGEIQPNEMEQTKMKMVIAARISDRMKELKISNLEFANKVYRNPSEITKWLSGTQNFTIETLVEICIALEIDLSILVSNNPLANEISITSTCTICNTRGQKAIYRSCGNCSEIYKHKSAMIPKEPLNIIIVSSLVMHRYTDNVLKNSGLYQTEPIKCEVQNGQFSLCDIVENRIGCYSRNNNDWEVSITYSQLERFNKFLKLLSEQPITLIFNDFRITIDCAII